MAKGKSAAAKRAEQFGYAKPSAYDADAEALRLEFEPLGLTDYEQADLAEALRLRLGTNAEQIASRAIIARLRVDLAEAIRRQADEAAALAGGKVSREGAALRIIGRDGLAELMHRGKVDRRQFAGGMAYRRRYEVAFKGLRSTLGTQATGVTPTIDEMQRSRTRLARYEVQRIAVEQLVAAGSPVALQLLRAVAGEGRALNTELAADKRSGKDYDRAVDLLAIALDICALKLPNDAG